MPKVSIIMPTYNVEKYFKQCIESVINQTLEDIEIIPVDDGSPDNCGAIMDEYAAGDHRIKPIHQANGGYGKAVNAGIAAATGEYIGIVETDDYIEPDMYEKLYNQAKRFDADVCKSSFYEYNSLKKPEKQNAKWIKDVQKIDTFPDDRSFSLKEYPQMMMFHASIWTNIYKKDFLEKNNIKLNETKSASYQDFPFMAEIMCKATKIAVVHDYLYHWRVEPNQNSSTVRNDKRLLIMAQQCEEVKKVVKQNSLYDIVKEEMYKHFFMANFGFYHFITIEHKREYFNKLHNLFLDLKDDKTFTYKYFYKNEINFVKNCITNRYWHTMPLRSIRRQLISIRWNKKEKSIRMFGKLIKEM